MEGAGRRFVGKASGRDGRPGVTVATTGPARQPWQPPRRPGTGTYRSSVLWTWCMRLPSRRALSQSSQASPSAGVASM